MISRAALVVLTVQVAALPAQDLVDQLDARLLPTIEARLASDTPADVAWGGYLAQRYRVSGATRVLCEALQRWRERDGLEARFVRLHLVDGLVGIGARVPTEQVEFLLGDPLTRAAAFVAMAADPAANLEGLIRLSLEPAERGDMVRRAAGLLLAARGLRTPRLGKFVVENLTCRFSMTVRDEQPETNQWNTAIGLGGGVGGRQRMRTKEGFPPLVRLAVSGSTNADCTVRLIVPGSSGRDPILLTRQEKASYAPPELERGELTPVPTRQALVVLLHAMSTVKVVGHTFADHQWRHAAGFSADYAERRDVVRRRLDRAVAQLRRRGWLRRNDLPDFRIKLDERVVDDRGDTSVPLPEIPAPPALGQ